MLSGFLSILALGPYMIRIATDTAALQAMRATMFTIRAIPGLLVGAASLVPCFT